MRLNHWKGFSVCIGKQKYIRIMYMQMDNSKPITLGLVYADWCGHCKAFKPEWKNVEDELKDNPNVQAISINENDKNKDEIMKNIDPTLVAEGYPTIFKKVAGKPVEYYQGERNATELLKWVSPQKGGCNCGKLWKTKKVSRKRREKTRRRRRHGGRRTFSKRKN